MEKTISTDEIASKEHCIKPDSAPLLRIGQHVKVGRLSDETGRKVEGVGEIVDLNTNGLTGNTAEDPLYQVTFPNGECESYWREELDVVQPEKGA